MQLRWYKTLWGAVGAGAPYRTFAEVVEVISAEGWDGIAFAPIALQFDPTPGTADELATRCAAAGLSLSVMVHAWAHSLDENLIELEARLNEVQSLGAHHVVAHAGFDSWTFAERSEIGRAHV